MDRSGALSILGLSEDRSGISEVERAFQRLIRRYPRQSFPERFDAINEAAHFLRDPRSQYQEILTASELDLSFLGELIRRHKPSLAPVAFSPVGAKVVAAERVRRALRRCG